MTQFWGINRLFARITCEYPTFQIACDLYQLVIQTTQSLCKIRQVVSSDTTICQMNEILQRIYDGYNIRRGIVNFRILLRSYYGGWMPLFIGTPTGSTINDSSSVLNICIFTCAFHIFCIQNFQQLCENMVTNPFQSATKVLFNKKYVTWIAGFLNSPKKKNRKDIYCITTKIEKLQHFTDEKDRLEREPLSYDLGSVMPKLLMKK